MNDDERLGVAMQSREENGKKNWGTLPMAVRLKLKLRADHLQSPHDSEQGARCRGMALSALRGLFAAWSESNRKYEGKLRCILPTSIIPKTTPRWRLLREGEAAPMEWKSRPRLEYLG